MIGNGLQLLRAGGPWQPKVAEGALTVHVWAVRSGESGTWNRASVGTGMSLVAGFWWYKVWTEL